MYKKLCTEFYDNDKPFANSIEVTFYKDYIKRDHLVLAPMCGTGRLLIPLLQAGYNVHGLDNSIHMLANCREKLEKYKLDTELFEESIKKIELKYRYDAIIIPLGSFQLIHPRIEAYEALEKFYKLLKKNGKLIFDMFIPWEAMYENSDEEIEEERATELSDGSIIILNSQIKSYKYEQYYTSFDKYRKIIDDEVVETEEEEINVCWYFTYEFELLLEKFGFSNIKRKTKIVNDEEVVVYIAEKL